MQWRPEVRLGLQEALVNAAKHGNNLDPSKQVLVRFFTSAEQCWWVISDQGAGFQPPRACSVDEPDQLPCDHWECGRGLHILHQIFDQVQWNSQGTELSLGKRVEATSRQPLLS
jgi:serine/threonine-protein kinase RsbW